MQPASQLTLLFLSLSMLLLLLSPPGLLAFSHPSLPQPLLLLLFWPLAIFCLLFSCPSGLLPSTSPAAPGLTPSVLPRGSSPPPRNLSKAEERAESKVQPDPIRDPTRKVKYNRPLSFPPNSGTSKHISRSRSPSSRVQP